MKPKEYTPKAREAFGRSLIDIGVAIFKSLILLITIVPIAAIFKATVNGGDSASLTYQLLKMPCGSQALVLAFILLAMLIGHCFRKAGLQHIHESELQEGKHNSSLQPTQNRSAVSGG